MWKSAVSAGIPHIPGKMVSGKYSLICYSEPPWIFSFSYLMSSQSLPFCTSPPLPPAGPAKKNLAYLRKSRLRHPAAIHAVSQAALTQNIILI